MAGSGNSYCILARFPEIEIFHLVLPVFLRSLILEFEHHHEKKFLPIPDSSHSSARIRH
jgi:hypothetical protein